MVGRRPSTSSRPTSAPSTADHKINVPKLNKDPIWALRPWPVTVTFAGQEYEIPALSAADWLAYLMQPEPDLDSMITDLLPEAENLVYDLQQSPEPLYELCLDLIATVSARPWWVALRQIMVAYDSWNSLGPELNVDATQVSLAMWLDALLLVILKNMEPKDTTMFIARLEAVPVQLQNEVVQEMEMSRDAFLSLTD